MSNKKIPLKDKALIRQRLAEGMSTRQAIRGTAVRSKDTAARMLHEQSAEIGQLRELYLKEIESFDAGRIDRAKLWAEMTRAVKVFSSHTEPDREVPDWINRREALKYIDTLSGIANTEQDQLNMQINIMPLMPIDNDVPKVPNSNSDQKNP